MKRTRKHAKIIEQSRNAWKTHGAPWVHAVYRVCTAYRRAPKLEMKIQVHWARETTNGAPNLVTELTVGRPDLVDTLQQ